MIDLPHGRSGRTPQRPLRPLLIAIGFALLLGACRGSGEPGETVRLTIPAGSGFGAVTDSLAARGLVSWTPLFRLYARINGAERQVKPGVYDVPGDIAWSDLLDKLVSGDVVQMTIAVPEGWMLSQIAPRIATSTGADADSLLTALLEPESAERYSVPGPSVEGYLYPATYTFPMGATADQVVRAMVARHQQVWTDARTARADSLQMTPREIVTLASIVEKEAKTWGERDTIAAVYHNRLRIGMPLQADPTVQYALGTHQTRLLYAHIDSVADHPYNTYRNRGLPPGPIASPSTGAIDATLNPATVDFLYFVARPNGTHVFTRSLAEHNAARQLVSRMRDEAQQAAGR